MYSKREKIRGNISFNFMEFFCRVEERFCSVLCDVHDIFDPNAPLPGYIDPRFDAKDYARLKLPFIPSDEIGILMSIEA